MTILLWNGTKFLYLSFNFDMFDFFFFGEWIVYIASGSIPADFFYQLWFSS